MLHSRAREISDDRGRRKHAAGCTAAHWRLGQRNAGQHHFKASWRATTRRFGEDRPALSMIRRAEAWGHQAGRHADRGHLGQYRHCAGDGGGHQGYRMVLVMPEDLSIERAQTMKAFGAELMLTPAAAAWNWRAIWPRPAKARRRQGAGPVRQCRQPASTSRRPARDLGADGRASSRTLCQPPNGHHHRVSRFLKQRTPMCW